MKVSVEKLPNSEAVLEVDVTWDEMEKASDKAYRKLVGQIEIKGFRPGRAPRSLVERRLGKEYIYQEGLDDLITEAYRNTVKEHNLTPITQPKLDAPVFEMGQAYHFTLTVPIVTPVELGDYHSLHFDREEVNVTSEEVDKELESLRNRDATWEEVERPADYDDRVTMNLKLTSDDQTISDLKDNPFELTRERTGLFTGLDENIVGMSVGESKAFSTTLPEDYSNTKLAGKEANYEVALLKIEVKQAPELDDAFAEKVSDGQYSTVEDLSKILSDNILEQKRRRVRDGLREQAIKAVAEQSQFTIHPLLIDQEAEEMLHQLSHALEPQRISLDQYLLMMRKSREEYLQEVRPEAEERIKRQLILDEIASKEEITIEPSELESLFNFYAQMGQPLPNNQEQIRMLVLQYRREKAWTRLIELTTDPDPDAKSDEQLEAGALAAAQEAATLEQEQETSQVEDAILTETDNDTMETDASTTATPPTDNSAATTRE